MRTATPSEGQACGASREDTPRRLALAPAAHASLTVTPSTTQAGAHADVTLGAAFAQTPTSVVLHLPPGLVGNPNAAARCTVAAFEAGTCAPDSSVGTATASGTMVVVVLPVPVTATGTVYTWSLSPASPRASASTSPRSAATCATRRRSHCGRTAAWTRRSPRSAGVR